MKRKSVKRPKQPQKTACKWNSAEWDGMSERQAFDEDPIEVMSKMGKVIASQTWRNGSWSTVYEYKGRFFSVDEVGITEHDNASDAFTRASIARDDFDEIDSMVVARKYRSLVD